MTVRYRVDVDSPSGGWWTVVDVPVIPEDLAPMVDDMIGMALDDLETIYAEEGLRASRDEIASQMLITLLERRRAQATYEAVAAERGVLAL